MTSYKILVSCYACNPYQGSEPGLGWKFVYEIAKYHKLNVITESKFQEPLEQKRAESPEMFNNIQFYFIEKQRHKTLRKLWPPSYYWFYKQWQKKTFRLALELDENEHFDLVHQLNMTGFREPGYLWKMKRPFIWGPIGGLEDVRFKLLLNLNLTGFIYYSTRYIINKWQKRFYRRPRKAAARGNNVLIAATLGNKNLIQKYWKCDSLIIPEVGQELISSPIINIRSADEPLIIVWSGQHTHGKALNILLKALKLLPENINWQLSILGSGEMTRNWQILAEKYNINQKCIWHTWLKKEDAHRVMQESHVLCITSIHDLTSTVILEGLSFGLPVVCIDHCGFSNVVNETCGIKIKVDYPLKLALSFRDTIVTLFSDEFLRQQLSKGALVRSSDYNWENKGREINGIYNSLLSQK